jgi:ATP-dependent protease HslVU (ClpYQ) peptidase subunit
METPAQIGSTGRQAAGTLRAPSDVEQTTTQEAGPSGLRVQGANIDKPTEEDTTVQQLRTAKIKLFEAARSKIKKARGRSFF